MENGSTPTTYHASCLCTGVRYTLTGEPFHFVICHCKNCKQVAGSAFMTNAMFKPEQVNVTRGQELIKVYEDGDTLSGRVIERCFCSKCGCPVYIRPASKEFFITHPSNIREQVAWVPKKEFHGNDRWSWIKEITFQPPKKGSKL